MILKKVMENLYELDQKFDEVTESNNLFEMFSLREDTSFFLYDCLVNPNKYEKVRKFWGDKKYFAFVEKLVIKDTKLNNKLEKISKFDELTGLYNKKVFDFLFDAQLKLYLSKKKKNLTQAMIDIDNFKNVNDNLGHLKGNEILKDVSNAVKNILNVDSLETHDSLGKINSYPSLVKNYMKRKKYNFAAILGKTQVGRFGGEEIIMAFPNSYVSSAEISLNEIRRKIEQDHKKVRAGSLKGVTISGGVQSIKEYLKICSFLNRSNKDLENITEGLFVQSDASLYVAKTVGKNKILSFKEAIKNINRYNIEKFLDVLESDIKTLNKIRKFYGFKLI